MQNESPPKHYPHFKKLTFIQSNSLWCLPLINAPVGSKDCWSVDTNSEQNLQQIGFAHQLTLAGRAANVFMCNHCIHTRISAWSSHEFASKVTIRVVFSQPRIYKARTQRLRHSHSLHIRVYNQPSCCFLAALWRRCAEQGDCWAGDRRSSRRRQKTTLQCESCKRLSPLYMRRTEVYYYLMMVCSIYIRRGPIIVSNMRIHTKRENCAVVQYSHILTKCKQNDIYPLQWDWLSSCPYRRWHRFR